MKKKLLILIALVALVSAITASTVAASANGDKKVAGTASIAWLGPANFLQSAQGGATLFAGGTMAGNIIASSPNGQIVLHVTPVFWSPDPVPGFPPGALILFCQEVRIVKGPDLGLPRVFCDVVPVTGGPVLVDIDGNILLRVDLF